MRPIATKCLWLTAVCLALNLSFSYGEEEEGWLDIGDEILALGEETEPDFDLLATSHLSELHEWEGVAALQGPRKSDDGWKTVVVKGKERFAAVQGSSPYPPRLFVKPTAGKEISTRVNIPRKGNYRIWLSYMIPPGSTRPVKMTLSGPNVLSHTFGSHIIKNQHGSKTEKELPIRFETDIAREAMSMSFDAQLVWEYIDINLEPGKTVIVLSSADQRTRLDSIFITRSKVFVPNKSIFNLKAKDNSANLTRTYVRCRVKKAKKASKTSYGIKSFIHYASPHYRRGYPNKIWYSSFMPGSTRPFPSVSGKPALKEGEWSQWIDVTERVTSGGTWGRNHLTVDGMNTGIVELQIAWFPEESAVLRTIDISIDRSKAIHTFPVNRYGYRLPVHDKDKGGWGMRDVEYLAFLQNERELLRELISSVDMEEIIEPPPLKYLRFYTTCAASPSTYDIAVPFLKRVGFNWLSRLSLADREKFGLEKKRKFANQGSIVNARIHSPLDPTFDDYARKWAEDLAASLEKDDPQIRTRANLLKMGDEIGPICSPAHINGLSDCRKAFHDYLREQLDIEGQTPEFFGVKDIGKVDFSLERSPYMGRYLRRTYYHSARFNWVLTSKYYERLTKAAQTVFPEILTSCNYTPGSFMFGGDMTSSHWFALARHGGSNMAFGEGWIRRRGRYGFGGTQDTSYYASIVECAARKHDLPMWFILVGSCGEIDRKIQSLVSHGIRTIYLYNWGPSYASVDSFSSLPWTYPQINRGVRAVAAAEDTIVNGKRSERKTALVYNRTDEIWNSGKNGLYIDRLMTHHALRHSHIPVDLILDTDLVPDILNKYSIVYLNGINLPRKAVTHLTEWVRNGGILYGTAESAVRDEYDDTNPDTTRLFGAFQTRAGQSQSSWYYSQWWPIGLRLHTPIDTIKVSASDLTPAIEAGVVGVKTVLTPTTGTSIATYSDGTCAGVVNRLGKGKTLLLGVMPGLLYGHTRPIKWEGKYDNDADGRPIFYSADKRDLISTAAIHAAGEPDTVYSEPFVEVTRFEDENHIVVLLTDFTYHPGKVGSLTVSTEKKITRATSVFAGELEWEAKDGKVTISLPVPDPIETVILQLEAR